MSKPSLKTIANIITVNLIALAEKKEVEIDKLIKHEDLITLAILFEDKKINNQGLQKSLELLSQNPDLDAQEIVSQNGLIQVNDSIALQAFVDLVIANNPQVVAEFKSGKEQILGFLVGQCMKESKGKGNPQRFSELLREKLTT